MATDTPRSRRRAVVLSALGLALALGGTTGAAAEELGDQAPPPQPDGGIAEQVLHDSVIAFETQDHVIVFDPSVTVFSLGDDVAVDSDETTITLSTDLLFRENTWELPTNAGSRVVDLVADVPDGATVAVVGHTDTQQPIGHDFDNQELSENRAEAVAAVLRAERPDLTLDVSGRGDTQPRATGEDAGVHRENRRVEITYVG